MAPSDSDPPAAAAGIEDEGAQTLGMVQITQTEAVSLMQRYSWLSAVFALSGIALMVASNAIGWASNTVAGQTGSYCPGGGNVSQFNVMCDPRAAAEMLPLSTGLFAINAVRGCISFTTFCALVCLYGYYAQRLRWMISKTQVAENSSVFSSPALRWPFLLEALLLLVHIFPGFEAVTAGLSLAAATTLYLFLTQFMLVRTYGLIRALEFSSSLMSANGRFLSSLTRLDFGTSFVAKNALKERPLVTVMSLLVVIVLSTSYALSWSETLLCVADPSLGCMPLSFDAAAWLIVVTMTTVGYGDLVARTTAGRVISMIGGIFGLLVLACGVALLNNSLALSRSELKVVAFLRKHENRSKIKNAAATAIQTAYRLYRLKHGGFAWGEEDALRKRLAVEMKQTSRLGGSGGVASGVGALAGKMRKACSRSRPVGPAAASGAAFVPQPAPKASTELPLPVLAATASAANAHSRNLNSAASSVAAFADDPASALSTAEDASRSLVLSPTGSPLSSPTAGTVTVVATRPAPLFALPSSDQLQAVHTPGSPFFVLSPGGESLPRSHRVLLTQPPTAATSSGGASTQLRGPPGIILEAACTQTPSQTPSLRRQKQRWSFLRCFLRTFSSREENPSKTVSTAEVRLFERLLFARVQAFRSLRKLVGRSEVHDPTDRQLTLLEALEASVGDLQTDISVLAEFLLVKAGVLGAGPAGASKEATPAIGPSGVVGTNGNTGPGSARGSGRLATSNVLAALTARSAVLHANVIAASGTTSTRARLPLPLAASAPNTARKNHFFPASPQQQSSVHLTSPSSVGMGKQQQQHASALGSRRSSRALVAACSQQFNELSSGMSSNTTTTANDGLGPNSSSRPMPLHTTGGKTLSQKPSMRVSATSLMRRHLSTAAMLQPSPSFVSSPSSTPNADGGTGGTGGSAPARMPSKANVFGSSGSMMVEKVASGGRFSFVLSSPNQEEQPRPSLPDEHKLGKEILALPNFRKWADKHQKQEEEAKSSQRGSGQAKPPPSAAQQPQRLGEKLSIPHKDEEDTSSDSLGEGEEDGVVSVSGVSSTEESYRSEAFGIKDGASVSVGLHSTERLDPVASGMKLSGHRRTNSKRAKKAKHDSKVNKLETMLTQTLEQLVALKDEFTTYRHETDRKIEALDKRLLQSPQLSSSTRSRSLLPSISTCLLPPPPPTALRTASGRDETPPPSPATRSSAATAAAADMAPLAGLGSEDAQAYACLLGLKTRSSIAPSEERQTTVQSYSGSRRNRSTSAIAGGNRSPLQSRRASAANEDSSTIPLAVAVEKVLSPTAAAIAAARAVYAPGSASISASPLLPQDRRSGAPISDPFSLSVRRHVVVFAAPTGNTASPARHPHPPLSSSPQNDKK